MTSGDQENWPVREALPLIYKALEDLRHAAEAAGGRIRYTPADADPLERLRLLLDLPESKWKKVAP